MLRQGSGIHQAVIAARGYRTITQASELKALGFSPAPQRAPGLLLPLWTTDGQAGPPIYRPDNPRVLEDRRAHNPDGTHPNRVIKYEMPKGAGVRLDCPPPCLPGLQNPALPLWITEGQKKADSLASAGLCAVALLGVWNFKGRNEFGASTFLADWDCIALRRRKVRIVFDSDVMVKHGVRQALERLKELLQRRGAYVDAVYLPARPGNGKLGVDDWLAEGRTVEELEALVEAPRPLPRPAPPETEILPDEPASINRPLRLVEGVSYAAAWPYVRFTVSERMDKHGVIQRLDPPLVKNQQELFVIRGDGVTFSEHGGQPLSELGLEVKLPELLEPEKGWSGEGIRRYLAGERPDPLDVFQRVAEVVDRFIDFERSLAPQKEMVELITCFILATWFLDAFFVIGYLWPNGDRGCGKTNLLAIVSELAHLGHLILAGGSYASIRDLADYGATLALDDAENLSDPHKTDPDKRALLLAGNRRGASVTLKELDANRKWVTRRVNAFCPFLFSAIRLPDPVLASRTIVIPLVRTVDRGRANADPLDYSAWPHPRRELVDDLWALGLSRLPELPEFDAYASRQASLSGRNLQPWRSILAVAAWLDNAGVPGLWARMDRLSLDYQSERPELEFSDLVAMTVKAILSVAESQALQRRKAGKETWPFEFTTAELTALVKQAASLEEGTLDPEHINATRIGLVLRKMRLRSFRKSNRTPRGWSITGPELKRLAQSYTIPVPDELLGSQNFTEMQTDSLPEPG